jgi:hypothetical protein
MPSLCPFYRLLAPVCYPPLPGTETIISAENHTQKEYFATASYKTWTNGKAVTLIILKKNSFYFILAVAKVNQHHNTFPQNNFYLLSTGSC